MMDFAPQCVMQPNFHCTWNLLKVDIDPTCAWVGEKIPADGTWIDHCIGIVNADCP